MSSVPIGRKADLPWLLLVLSVVLYAALFAVLAVLRHHAFQSHAFDLGNMDQAVWSTLHGNILRFTDMQVGDRVLTQRPAIHVEPLLVALAPMYLVWDSPDSLLVLQAIVVSSGAIPVYLLARQLLRRRYTSLAFAFAYLAHPSLQNALLDDFHAVALSACFLAWALWFCVRGQLWPFVVAATLAASTKEEVGTVVGLMGLLWLRRSRRVALIVLTSGFAWSALCIAVIIPHFNPAGESPYVSRYGYLGHGARGLALGLLRHPAEVARVIGMPSRLRYLQSLLQPLGWTPLLAPAVLVLALPVLAINMLSTDPTMFSGYYQYSVELVPILVCAAAAGATVVARVAERFRAAAAGWVAPALASLVMVASFVDTRRYGFTPIAEGYAVPKAGQHQRLESEIVRRIPPGAAVSASDEIEPHLSHRYWIYLLPTMYPRNGPAPDFVVLDASIPSLPVLPASLHSVALRALHKGFGIEEARDGILLLRRGALSDSLPASFYSFAFNRRGIRAKVGARWGDLRLVGATLHPANGRINRARPSIEVETYWKVLGPLPPGVQIRLYASPVYSAGAPRFSPRWTSVSDSPTLDWLPVNRWPLHRTVHAAFVPFVPNVAKAGKIDVDVAVFGAGPLSHTRTTGLSGSASEVRIGTVQIDP